MKNTQHHKLLRLLMILLLACNPFVSFATFTLNGSTITQSGVDTNLSGLAGVFGVTTYQEGNRTIYDIGVYAIHFSGTITIDGTDEGIISRNTGWAFRFRPNADVTINDFTDENGVKTYHEDKVLSCGKDGEVYFDSGANLNMNGGWIECGLVATPESLQNGIQLNIKYGVFGSYKSTTATLQFRTFTQNLNVTGKLILIKMGYTLRTTLNNAINAFETRYGVTALRISSSSPSGENEFKNFSSVGTENIALLWDSKKVVFINTEKGTDYGVGNNAQGNSVSKGTILVKKEVQPKLADVSGNPISGAVVFIRDTDNGNRTNGNGYTFSTDKTYSEITDANGQTQVFKVLTGVVNEPVYDASPDWDYRSKNGNSEDEFDMYFLAYGKLIAVSTQKLKGFNTLQFDWTLFDDPNISETDKATVDAYTSIDNLEQLYDRAMSWKVAAANVEVPTIDGLLITGNVDHLDLGDYNLVVDAAAASVFAVDTATKMITINSATLLVGNRFTSITTTGTVSTANGATLEFGYIDNTGTNKYVQLNGLTNYDVEVIDNSDPNNQTIISSSSNFTGDYKDHFLLGTSTEVLVRLKTGSGHIFYSEVYPQQDLSFIRSDFPISASEENQDKALYLALKILQKEETIYQTLEGTTAATVTIANTIVNSDADATAENQIAIIQLLERILSKITANRNSFN